MRRALRRASDAATLNLDEIEVLLSARGEELTQLCAAAARVRDAGLLELNRAGVITYSPKVFIPLTRLCRDRCHYCTFATTPNHLPAAYLEIAEVIEIAKAGAEKGCLEALFTLGDRPEDRWEVAADWLSERGYSSTLDYLRACAIAVLEETGLLPHLNPGVMSFEELSRLRPVGASMGMMLETSATRLFSDKGEVHFGSPDKDPAVRFRTIEDAGRLSIPFTTGILDVMDRDQLQGVIAHELAHVANRDTLVSAVAATTAGAIAILSDFLTRMMWFGGGRGRDRPRLPPHRHCRGLWQ